MADAVEGSIVVVVDLPFVDELISVAIVVLVPTTAGISETGASVRTDVFMDTAIADVDVAAIGVIVVVTAGIRITCWELRVVCFGKDPTDTSAVA